MKEKRNVHLKVQEFCDCYATSDPLKEMSILGNGLDTEEAAYKWLALAALHGINSGAKKISISRSTEGDVLVTAKYRKASLPSPDNHVGGKIISAVREMTHIERDKGSLPFSLGIRDSNVDLNIKIESEKGQDKVTIHFSE
jgi:hypothetical protein